MTDVQLQYWEDIVSEALEAANVKASAEQVTAIAADIQGAHENWDMAFPTPSGGSHLLSEIDDLKRQLSKEREKIVCPECHGRGRLISHGPSHSSDFECFKCRGEGRVSP